MMNLVGELVLTRNQVLQATSADPNMTMLSRRLDMVTADLRESVMKARMQPVSNIFGKIPRIVRDLSQSLGRRVRLQVEGQDTELDKSLLEAIKDPLTHAVRNSLDHGIEPPAEREAAGKDPEGTLKLRAVQEGSHVVIEISDDGAGIAVDKVRQKAIERGLITPDRAAHMAERELQQLIFLPGFSTAAAVTNVSGRGVGMDVVRTNVEKIGGKVEIDSRVGKGTTLRMRIPLTLAIIPALTRVLRCPRARSPSWCMCLRSRLPRRSNGSRMLLFTGCAASCCRWFFLTGCWCRTESTRRPPSGTTSLPYWMRMVVVSVWSSMGLPIPKRLSSSRFQGC
jgi:two-component system chemotaxis sensor kinase CheA